MTLSTPSEMSHASSAAADLSRRRRTVSALRIVLAVGAGVLGAAALILGMLMILAPWPFDPVMLTRAIQVEFLFVWGGFGALVAAVELFIAAIWGRKPRP